MWIVREERPDDRAAVHAVVAAAFGRPDEADLVDRLRAAGEVVMSLVAEAPAGADGAAADIVGHVLFSPLPLTGAGHAVPAAALAPLAVRPEHHGQGVGSALVREGLARLEAMRVPAVVVLGDPDYYRRFGFRADLAARLVAPFSGGAFMAVELVPGTLAAGGLTARYASAFGVE